jgi:hypothetical protein
MRLRLDNPQIRNVFSGPREVTMADKHPKRPRDPNQLGKLIVDIAVGQVEDRSPTPEEQGKDPAAAPFALARRRAL